MKKRKLPTMSSIAVYDGTKQNNTEDNKLVAESRRVQDDLRDRSSSPLPDLIIEVEPNKHDEPEEFYDQLFIRMQKNYRKWFIEKRFDESDSHYSESRDQSHNLDTKDNADTSQNWTLEEETDLGILLSEDEQNVPHETARQISSIKNSTLPHEGDTLIESDNSTEQSENETSSCSSSPMPSYRQVTTRAEVHPYTKDTVPLKRTQLIHKDAIQKTSNVDHIAEPTDDLTQLEKPYVSDIGRHHQETAHEFADVEVMRKSRVYVSRGSIPQMEDNEDRQRKSILDTQKPLTQYEYAMSHCSKDSTQNFIETEEALNSEILHTSVFAEDLQQHKVRNETQKRKNSSPKDYNISSIKRVKKRDVSVQTSTRGTQENLLRLSNTNFIFAEPIQLHRVCSCPLHKY